MLKYYKQCTLALLLLASLLLRDSLYCMAERIITQKIFQRAKSGDFSQIPELIKQGFPVAQWRDNNASSLLHWAALNGNCEAVAFLIKAGTDINIRNQLGSTPLHIASLRGHCEVVKYLCDQGAIVNSSNFEGSTPLHKAASRGHCDVIQVLCHYGADVNFCDLAKRTPLHIASLIGQALVVECLIKHHHANLEVADLFGATPLHYAYQWCKFHVACILLTAGAQFDKQDYSQQTPLDYVHHSQSESHILQILSKTDEREILENSKKLCILFETIRKYLVVARRRTAMSAGILAHAAVDRLGGNSPAHLIDSNVYGIIFELLRQAEEHDAYQAAIAQVTQKMAKKSQINSEAPACRCLVQ